jgi:hypothetical protein
MIISSSFDPAFSYTLTSIADSRIYIAIAVVYCPIIKYTDPGIVGIFAITTAHERD